MILQELDFRPEADNIERIAASFTGAHATSASRRCVRELSTARVLTTEWIDGVKVSDRARLAALGVDRGAAGAHGGARLLPADLHRRRLPRRSAPGEPAGAASAGGRGDDRVHRLRRGGRGVAARCGAASST